jgi:hypothetical protein
MELAKAKPAGTDWNEVRGWFVKANRLDTENAEPLMLFYKSFLAAGARPTDSATKGLLYALVLAPHDAEVRLMAVRELLIDGRVPEAKRAIEPLAFDPHSERSQGTAGKILTAIESGKPDAAVSLIDDWRKRRDKKEH